LTSLRAAGDRLPLATLLAGGLLLALVRFNNIFSLNGDNAIYLLLARNLATGQPYNNAGFPWGYPALLTPGVLLFGPTHLLQAIPWLKGLSVLAFLLAIGCLYALFRTRHSRLVAWATVALFAVNDVALVYTNDLMTELPYLAATAAALLYWAHSIDPAPRPATDPSPQPTDAAISRGPWLLAALLLVLPYYLRTIGLALLAAPPLILAWRRRWRAALGLGLALAALALPWIIFSATTAPDRNYTAAFWLRDPYHPELGRLSGPGELLSRVTDRVSLYSNTVLPAMVLPQPADPAAPWRQAGGGLLVLLAGAGYGLRLYRRVELPEVYVAAFLVILCSWWWAGDRFLLPVFPFLLHYIAEALTTLAALAGRALRTPRLVGAAAVVLILLLLPNLVQDGQTIGQNLRYLRGDPAADGLTPEDRTYLAACDWLRQYTPEGSVLLARKSSVTEIYTGRPTELIPLIPPDQYLGWLTSHHVRYVLEDSFAWSTHTIQYLRPAMAQYPAHFRLLASLPTAVPADPPTRLWQFTP